MAGPTKMQTFSKTPRFWFFRHGKLTISTNPPKTPSRTPSVSDTRSHSSSLPSYLGGLLSLSQTFSLLRDTSSPTPTYRKQAKEDRNSSCANSVLLLNKYRRELKLPKGRTESKDKNSLPRPARLSTPQRGELAQCQKVTRETRRSPLRVQK